MRFAVPQFIEIEDKIFGPLTWRQFLYVGGGVGMAVVMFFTLPLILAILFGLPLALISGALAFYPVNNRPFSYFLEAIFNYLRSKRLYLWRKQSDYVYKESVAKKQSGYTGPRIDRAAAGNEARGINSLARKLELQALQKNE
jgi:hypothetical protein